MAKSETHLGLVRRARRLSRALEAAYPDAHCELNFTNPLQLTVATILSAQCTDKRVNQVTPALFDRYQSAEDYANADINELQEYIRSTGFYKNKARSLMGLGEQLVEKYDGEVPGRLEDLVELPGIGRKTANVVLGNAFGVPGLTVDTHFGRLVRRMGLTTAENPVIVEREIGELIERPRWTNFSHELIIHGRRVCHSRRAACGMCFLAKDCRGYGEFGPTEPDAAEKLVKGEERDRIIALAQQAMETGRMPDSRTM